MKLIVFSDTHAAFSKLHTIVKKHLDDADVFIHLGDGMKEFEDIQTLYPDKTFIGVQGNCDFYTDASYATTFDTGNGLIFATHGHICDVKSSLERLKERAHQNHALIALYGHTHENFTTYQDGLHMMNPGSLSRPRNSNASYGTITVNESGILTHIVEVERF